MLLCSSRRFLLASAASLLVLAACGRSNLADVEASPGEVGYNATQSNAKIKIVGSSTVAPFSTTVAERFGATSGFDTPIVETTGTGGGFAAFCEGVGPETASVANASRKIKAAETELCATNGVTGITEVRIGFDGITLVNDRNGAVYDLTLAQIYLALAKDIPDGAGGFKANPHKTWKDVDAKLPADPIQMFGPPPTSGTRDAFVELGLEAGALTFPEMKALKEADGDLFKERTHTIRTDGAWIDAGENDSAIIQQVTKAPGSLGVLGFSFLEQNGDRVRAAKLNGVDAAFENIASGDYALSRSMYFYVKDQNVSLVAGVDAFVAEFVSDAAMGPDGYLLEKGLIPLTDADRAAQQAIAAGFTATP